MANLSELEAALVAADRAGDEASARVLAAAIQSRSKQGAREQVMSDPITQGALNPAGEMGAGERFLAGMGKTFTDLGQGAAQMVGMGPTAQEVEERRDRDVSLMATPAGFGGSMAGGIAAAAPTAALGTSMPAVAGAGAIYGALQPVGEGESRALNTAIGAGTAGAMKYGMDKAVPMITQGIQRAQSAAAPANARSAEIARVLQQGQEAGLRVPPSQTNPSALNRILESIAGKAATQQRASAINQDVAYAAAQRHAGIPGSPLTEANLEAARKAAAEPYRQLAGMNPQIAGWLEKWKDANFNARMQQTFFERSGNPEAYQAASAAKSAANDAIRHIEALAGQGSKEALQAARQQIAKIHSVENIMRGSSVDPAALVRQVNKGVPISGELANIARFAQDFPKAMQAPQVGGSVGVNQLMPWLGGGGGAALGGVLGGPGGAGAGSLLGAAATQAIPPALRSVILSGPYQRMMTTPPQVGPGITSRIASVLLQNPELRAMLPAAAAGYASSQ
jgi:hypothetical protein